MTSKLQQAMENGKLMSVVIVYEEAMGAAMTNRGQINTRVRQYDG